MGVRYFFPTLILLFIIPFNCGRSSSLFVGVVVATPPSLPPSGAAAAAAAAVL
jgi:hypothetical protein